MRVQISLTAFPLFSFILVDLFLITILTLVVIFMTISDTVKNKSTKIKEMKKVLVKINNHD